MSWLGQIPRSLTLILCLLCVTAGTAQFEIPKIPDTAEDRFVYDPGDFLEDFQQKDLARKLINYADTTSTQIVVAIIPSTLGEDISLLSTKWGQTWGVGQAEEDNGIFILLAHQDRKIDISTGYGIEYRITDLETERILNRIILPEFKRGDYYAGLNNGVDAIFEALNGEFVSEYEDTSDLVEEWMVPVVIFFIMFIWFGIMIFLAIKYKGNVGGGGSRTYGSGGSYSGWSSGSSSSSWSSGSSSSSFGGGSFGGGGASGSW